MATENTPVEQPKNPSDDVIKEAVERYRREYDRYVKLTEFIYMLCMDVIGQTTLRATVQRRTKTLSSFEEKLRRIQRKNETVRPPNERDMRFDTVDGCLCNMSDLAAVRIATYLEGDREDVVKLVCEAFGLVTFNQGEQNPDPKDNNKYAKYYQATHCQVLLKQEHIEQDNNFNLEGASCEVQVCSMLRHVWNEIEHDIGYKPLSGVLSATELDCLDALGNLVRSGDKIIGALMRAQETRISKQQQPQPQQPLAPDSPAVESATGQAPNVSTDFETWLEHNLPGRGFEDHFEFAVWLKHQFPEFSGTIGRHSAQLLPVLRDLGLDEPARLKKEFLADQDAAKVRAESLVADFKAYLTKRNDSVVMVDPESSDRFAMLIFETRAAKICGMYPAGRGHGRPMRIRSLADRFLMMQIVQRQSS